MPATPRTYESVASKLLPLKEKILRLVAAGDIAALAALESDACAPDKSRDIFRAAVKHGQVPVLEWLHARGTRRFWVKDYNFVIDSAVTMQWLLDEALIEPRDITLLNAECGARRGDLPLLQLINTLARPEVQKGEMALMNAAAIHGRVHILQWMKDEAGFDIEKNGQRMPGIAATHGHTAVLEWLHAQGMVFDEKKTSNILAESAINGHISVLQFMHKINPAAFAGATGRAVFGISVNHGHVAVMDWLLGTGVDYRSAIDHVLDNQPGDVSAAALECLSAHGIDWQAHGDGLMTHAAKKPNPDLFRYLHDKGFSCDRRHALNMAENSNCLRMLSFLASLGMDIRDDLRLPVRRYDQWMARHGVYPFMDGRHELSPYPVRMDTFNDVLEMLMQEGYPAFHDAARVYSYNAAALFGTTDRVLRYLEKWGQTGRQPLHDIIQNIIIPQTPVFKPAPWADAVLRHGPRMARLVAFGSQMPEPLKDPKGQWSFNLTRTAVAQNIYSRAMEAPELAAFCIELAWTNEKFERVLKEAGNYSNKYGAGAPKPGGRIPDIQIDGNLFDKPDCNFYKLPDGDPRGLILGEFTNCCQHLNGAGADCARHGFMSPDGGFYVVANKTTGKVVAQSWAWRGQGDELVLDSLESLGNQMGEKRWRSLCDEFARRAMADETAHITAVHVGKGGATPDVGYPTAEPPVLPCDYGGYRDSGRQYIIRP